MILSLKRQWCSFGHNSRNCQYQKNNTVFISKDIGWIVVNIFNINKNVKHTTHSFLSLTQCFFSLPVSNEINCKLINLAGLKYNNQSALDSFFCLILCCIISRLAPYFIDLIAMFHWNWSHCFSFFPRGHHSQIHKHICVETGFYTGLMLNHLLGFSYLNPFCCCSAENVPSYTSLLQSTF